MDLAAGETERAALRDRDELSKAKQCDKCNQSLLVDIEDVEDKNISLQ